MSDMNVQRVLDLIDAYGADMNAFPEDERDAARVLVEGSPALFAEALDAARLLDGALLQVPEISPNDDLIARLIASGPKPQPERINILGRLRDILLPQGSRWPMAAGLASLAIGALVGLNLPNVGTDGYDSTQGDVIYAALGLTEYTYDDEVFQ
jgi:hypothetical protein